MKERESGHGVERESKTQREREGVGVGQLIDITIQSRYLDTSIIKSSY